VAAEVGVACAVEAGDGDVLLFRLVVLVVLGGVDLGDAAVAPDEADLVEDARGVGVGRVEAQVVEDAEDVAVAARVELGGVVDEAQRDAWKRWREDVLG
jgi:hypothetical protein